MDELLLAAVGDVMLGDHPVCFGHGIRSRIRRKRPLFAPEFRPLVKDAEIVLGNLECVLSDIGHDEQQLKSSEMRGDPSSVNLLREFGFTTVSIANNHMLQHGVDAFKDTVSLLNENNIQPVGLYEQGKSNLVTYAKGQNKVAILGYSLRPEHFCKENTFYARPSPDLILEQVKEVKLSHPDHALVITLHWGEEYLHEPSCTQVNLAHQLIDAGAAVIIGHHPHVLQGIEEYKGGLIAYSLGNFVFDSWQAATRESALLTCTFKEGALESYSFAPVTIDKDFYVKPATGTEQKKINQKISLYSKAISEPSGLLLLNQQSYDALAEKTYLKYRIECYTYFLLHIWKYKPRVVFDSLFRAALRKVGLA